MFVLSPRQSVAARFRVEEARSGEELAYRVSYLSGLDIAPLGSEDRPFKERALALAATDFQLGSAGRTVSWTPASRPVRAP